MTEFEPIQFVVKEEPIRDEHIADEVVPLVGEPVCLHTRQHHEQLIKRSLLLNWAIVFVLLYPVLHAVCLAYVSDQAIVPSIVGFLVGWFALILAPLIGLVIRGIRIRKCLMQLRLARRFADNLPVGIDGLYFSYVTINGIRYSGNRETGMGVKRRLPWTGAADAPMVYFGGESNEPTLIIQGSRFALTISELFEYLPHTGPWKIFATQDPTRHFCMFIGVCFFVFGALQVVSLTGYLGFVVAFSYYAVFMLVGIALYWMSAECFGVKGAIAKREISKEIVLIEDRLGSAQDADADVAKDINALFWLNSALRKK